MTAAPGTVWFVGGGPGDPDLLTVEGERVLATAEVVVADPVVAGLVVTFAPDAEVLFADEGHGWLTRVRDGAVVRLLVGDPWLHPTYEAEVAAAGEAGLDVVTVPGISCELAATAEAGIAVHHRPRSVTVTIGALDDLPVAVDPARTLVAAVDDLHAAAAHLAATGDPDLPAAAIPVDGPYGEGHDACHGPLAELAAVAPAVPGTIVVGATARPIGIQVAGEGEAGGPRG